MQMPGMDGEALAHAIQKEEPLRATQIVMLTPLGLRRGVQRCKASGLFNLVSKPIHCRELVEAFQKARNEGTSQTLAAARALETADQEKSKAQQQPKALANARILLAEDNFTNQQVALAILKKLGIHADAVADGSEAIQALSTIPYDLVFMDMRMPVMDGVEATRCIRDPRSSVLNHGIPIVAMTANVMKADQDQCYQAGMNGFVPKPVSPQSIRAELEKWLSAASLSRPEDASLVARLPDRAKPAFKAQTLASQPSEPLKLEAQPRDFDALPVFDRAGMLKRLMDDEDLVDAILEGFLAETPRLMQKLEELVAKQDATQAGRQAHAIKGAAANVGAERLRKLALEMEKAGASGEVEKLRALMGELEAQFLQLKNAIDTTRKAAAS
jgi:CheY-like chemotaxis protein/HPt (histidine-containing phosphotransfer) domain-containing protein